MRTTGHQPVESLVDLSAQNCEHLLMQVEDAQGRIHKVVSGEVRLLE